MPPILSTLVTATLAFAATNIDDIFVVTLFFSQTGCRFRSAHIVAGQYLGFTALVAISLVGFFGGLILPRDWIGLLGFLPIFIGIRRWIHRHDPPQRPKSSVASTITVASVTFATGGDNLCVSPPPFPRTHASP